jgi:tetratricopeptide (TPR) repeat protein
MRRHELKAKARVLERAGQLQETRDLYLKLTAEEGDGDLAAIWTRLGDLQAAVGEEAAARESFRKALDLFTEGEQANNAIAVCLRLRRFGDDAALDRRLAQLALAKGHRSLARSTVLRLLTTRSDGEALDEAVAAALAFAERFPAERELWREAAAAVAAEAGDSAAADRVAVLADRLVAGGADDAARVLRAQIGDDGAPPESPAGGEASPPVRPHEIAGPGPSSTDAPATGSDLDSVRPLEGLQTTHPIDEPREPEDAVEPLPLMGAESPEGGEDGSDDGSDTDALPLVGLEPAPDRDGVEAADAGDDALPLLGSNDEPDPDEDHGVDEPLPLLGADADMNARDAHTARAADQAEATAEPETESTPEVEPAPDTGDSADPWADDAAAVGPSFDLTIEEDARLDIAAIAAELESVTAREVEASDPASHYDLGVAFKEMGLLEESIAQLAAAVAAGFNPLGCLEVLGEVLVGRGDNEIAARILRLAFSTAEAPDGELVSVLYWLGRADEALGNTRDAAVAFERVLAVDGDFRDAARRLRQVAPNGF